jgi:hypothetical protein
MLDWSPIADTFCTVGPKHNFFWTKSETKAGTVTFTKKAGSALDEAGNPVNMLCVAHDNDGNTYTGS